jgi:hypothetical protein
MDERKLGELFRDAVPDVPPPSFDVFSVEAESNRLRKRRKTALMGGSAAVVVVVALAGVLSMALWRGTNSTTSGALAPVSGSSGNAAGGSNEVPNEDAQQSTGGGASDRSFSAESPKQGGPPSGNAGPSGPGSTLSGCEKAAPELAAALAGELRAAVSAQRPADIGCPAVSRGVSFLVSDPAGHKGIVSLVVAPANAEFGNPLAGQPSGSELRATTTSDGRHLVLVSEPVAGSTDAPFKSDLQRIVDKLATKV